MKTDNLKKFLRSKSQHLTQYVPKPNLYLKPRYEYIYMALCDRKVFFKFIVADQRKRKKKGRLNIEKRIFTDLEK